MKEKLGISDFVFFKIKYSSENWFVISKESNLELINLNNAFESQDHIPKSIILPYYSVNEESKGIFRLKSFEPNGYISACEIDRPVHCNTLVCPN